jgi:hypothetical protein
VKGIAQQFDRNSSIRTYHYASINNTQELTVHNNLIEMAVKVFCRRDTTTNHYASINQNLPPMLSSCLINGFQCIPKSGNRNPVRRIFESSNIQYKDHIPFSMVSSKRWKMPNPSLLSNNMTIFHHFYTMSKYKRS